MEWKSLDGIVENGKYYEVSSSGEVRSIDREVLYKDGRKGKFKGKILKPNTDREGYKKVNLCQDGSQMNYSVHRLVALAFIPNSNNLPCVNHKDENKANNDRSNLEWCTCEYNNNYGTHIERQAAKLRGRTGIKHPLSMAVKGTHIKTGEIVYFGSIGEASTALNLSKPNISLCIKYHKDPSEFRRTHKQAVKTVGGYVWTEITKEEYLEATQYNEVM